MKKEKVVAKVKEKLALNADLQKLVNLIWKKTENKSVTQFLSLLKEDTKELGEEEYFKVVLALVNMGIASRKGYSKEIHTLISTPPLGVYFRAKGVDVRVTPDVEDSGSLK